jgi:hypothetical protein
MMSSRNVKPPLRIIAPRVGSPAGVPAPQADAALMAQRFMRAMVSRRPDPLRLRHALENPDALEQPAAPDAPASSGDAASVARQAPVRYGDESPASTAGSPAVVVAHALPADPPPLPAAQPDRRGTQDQREDGSSGRQPPDWQDALADVVGALCGRAEHQFETWSVTIPLPAALLPESTLRLSLSPHALHLRFHTDSPHSLALFWKNQERLIGLLKRAVPGTRDILIDVT